MTDTIFYFRPIELFQQEITAGSASPDKAFLSLVRHFVIQPELFDVTGRLICLTYTAF